MLTPSLYSKNSNPSQFLGVPQSTYAVTHGEDERAVLCTFQVCTCIVVTIYDTKTRVGTLAHLDSLTLVAETIKKMFEKFSVNAENSSNLKVNLIGGIEQDPPSKNLHHKIILELSKYPIETSENVFKKKISDDELLSLNQIQFDYDLLSLNQNENEEQKERLLSKIYAAKKSMQYTQVAFDTKTGFVFHSSKREHSRENFNINAIRSIKAKFLEKKLEDEYKKIQTILSLVECGIQPYSVLEEWASSRMIPAKKVYDATQKNKRYF